MLGKIELAKPYAWLDKLRRKLNRLLIVRSCCSRVTVTPKDLAHLMMRQRVLRVDDQFLLKGLQSFLVYVGVLAVGEDKATNAVMEMWRFRIQFRCSTILL